LKAAVLDPALICDDPLDRLGTFMIRNRARRPRGSMDELESDFRIWPLASLPAVRAAYALGSERRQDEFVHRRLIERHSRALAEHPFAGPGWSTSAQPATAAAPSPGTPGKSEPLIERGHRQFRDTRTELLESVFADRPNRIWDHVDRRVAVAALETAPDLAMTQLRQLCAVATAAVWLAS
jgi:hypothetical protein